MKKTLFSALFVTVFGIFAVFQRSNASINIATSGSSPGSSTITSTSAPIAENKLYKDGTFTGISADAYYGFIQVSVTTKNDKIVDIAFLDYPQDRGTSREINEFAIPQLKSEAIRSQSANVDMISGATDSTKAFNESLQSALDRAHV